MPQNVSLSFHFWHSLPILGKEAGKGPYQPSSAGDAHLPISSHPSFIQHLSGCFTYMCTQPLFLVPVSADKRPGHRCPLCPFSPRTHLRSAKEGDGPAPQDALGDNLALDL